MRKRAGAKPIWIGYVGVDDVDAVAGRVVKFGGIRPRPADGHPQYQPLFGRRRPANGGACAGQMAQARRRTDPPNSDGPGGVCWHELFAGDWEKAFAFYHEVFGWQKADADTGA